jgi:hypothetical protein
MKNVCANKGKHNIEHDELFLFDLIPVKCKKQQGILHFHGWLPIYLKKPGLAFPYGNIFSSASKRRQLWCTLQPSQSLESKQLEDHLVQGKDILKNLLIQKKSMKSTPSLLIFFPNLGRTAHSYFFDLHRSMDVTLVKEGFVLCTFNPAAAKSKYKKIKAQPLYPPVPFLLLRKLVKEDLDHFKENPKLTISYHHYFFVHLN